MLQQKRVETYWEVVYAVAVRHSTRMIFSIAYDTSVQIILLEL